MKFSIVFACVAIGLSACSQSGPVYRGAPPAGYTDAEYRDKLQGRSTKRASFWERKPLDAPTRAD